MIWPFSRRKAPEIETRASFPTVTHAYMASRRSDLLGDSGVPLSATIATCAQTWSRAFASVDTDPDPNPLTADVLAAIGMDLCLRGESCWHIRLDGSDVALHRVAFWDELGNGRWHLSIAQPHSTESVRALDGEVLCLRINSAPESPWRGRSPFALMGASPALMAEIESTISGSLEWVGRGLVAFPAEIPEEQQSAAIAGLKAGSRLAAIKSKADFATNSGQSRGSEFKRVELGPDLESADLTPMTEGLHDRLLAACGIPPALWSASGASSSMREAMRSFTLMTVIPIARSLLPQFAKVGVTSVSSKSMLSADVAGRARAVGTLVGAGMDLPQALKLVGWSDD